MTTKKNHNRQISFTHIKMIPSQTRGFNKDSAKVCSILCNHALVKVHISKTMMCNFSGVSSLLGFCLLSKSQLPRTGIILYRKTCQDASTTWVQGAGN